MAGKDDWFAAGLPREGDRSDDPWIGDLAERDVPTCRLGDPIGEARQRLRAAGRAACVVVNDEQVVLGLVPAEGPSADPRQTVEAVMESGPSTFRPNVPLAEMAQYMREHGLSYALVTTSDGNLVGWLSRERAERR